MKKNNVSRWYVCMFVAVIVLFLTACGGDKNAVPDGGETPNTNVGMDNSPPTDGGTSPAPAEVPPTPKVPDQPVELNFYYGSVLKTFEENYVDVVKRKYPNITLNQVTAPVAEALSTNTHYDIIFNSITVVGQFLEAGLTTDMDDYVKKWNVDTSRFIPEQLETLRLVGKGKLIGFPQKGIHQVLFYNKDLFDKFGEDYPRDGMTWDETLDIARRMTIEDGGVQYLGFASSIPQYLGQNQYGLAMVDPATHKVTFDDPRWKKMLETIVPFYTMSGYNPTKELINGATKLFREEHTVAMWLSDHTNYPKLSHGLNWDVVSAPVFDDMRGVGPTAVFTYYLLSSNSKHPDEAFLAIDQLTSKEVQIQNARELLYVPTIQDEEARNAFGEGNPDLQGINMKAFFPDHFADPILFDEFYTTGRGELANQTIEVILGNKDVNTAIREATETANQKVAEKLAN